MQISSITKYIKDEGYRIRIRIQYHYCTYAFLRMEINAYIQIGSSVCIAHKLSFPYPCTLISLRFTTPYVRTHVLNIKHFLLVNTALRLAASVLDACRRAP